LKEQEVLLVHIEDNFVKVFDKKTKLNVQRIVWSYLVHVKLIERFQTVINHMIGEEKSLLIQLRKQHGGEKVLSFDEVVQQYDEGNGWCEGEAKMLGFIELLCISEGLNHCLVESEKGRLSRQQRASRLSGLAQRLGITQSNKVAPLDITYSVQFEGKKLGLTYSENEGRDIRVDKVTGEARDKVVEVGDIFWAINGRDIKEIINPWMKQEERVAYLAQKLKGMQRPLTITFKNGNKSKKKKCGLDRKNRKYLGFGLFMVPILLGLLLGLPFAVPVLLGLMQLLLLGLFVKCICCKRGSN
jgi:hypothetical protein